MANKVFFLGAGFSKSINSDYPLLNQLTKDVLMYFEKTSLAQHYQFELPEQVKYNIEYLLTYLSTNLPWKNEKIKAIDKALYIEITEHIQKYFNNIESSINIDFEKYKKISDFIIHNYLSVITLNYDLLIEKIVQHNPKMIDKDIRKYYGQTVLGIDEILYPGSTSNHSSYIAKTQTLVLDNIREEKQKKYPLILKLHGSINWFYDSCSPANRVYCANNQTEDIALKLSPFIIPPVMDKNILYSNNTLKYMWQQAHDKIANADEIYIIGFSFPPTDLSIRYLFQSALRNKNSTNVYVINYDSNSNTRKTYEEIFKDSQLKCNIENNEWKFLGKNGFDKFLEEITNTKLEVKV